MEKISGRDIKGYQLQRKLGEGGFGAVYLAHQTSIGRDVAVKIIHPDFANQPDFIRRFETEAQTIARLEHMHIVPLYDYWRGPDGAYLIMRYLRGGSLRDAIKKNGPYDIRQTGLLLNQIASALETAHTRHIIHRDIKPENILLDEDENAYLADFGIAKDLNIKDGLTGNQDIVGSLDYISPEQARSEPVTARTDVYTLGVVLYEMLTGTHPWPELSSVERLYKHINDPLPRITELDGADLDALNDVIQKATAKNPRDRYQTPLALATAFQDEVVGTQPGDDDLVAQLTRREQEVLLGIIEGKSNKEIAADLVIELTTVKWYIRQIYGKLGVRSRVQAIIKARELDLIIDGTEESNRQLSSIHSQALTQIENPYKGLHTFTSADALDFFGRDRLIQKLVTRLAESRFLAVVGPSGSGKSSAVRAGLIPALWRGDMRGSDQWYVVDMLPGTRPLDQLEVALTRVATDQTTPIAAHLIRDANGLLRCADLILPNDDSELVIIIDQFEETFTLVEDEKARQHFLELLQAAATDSRSRVRIIVTLRADFYDRPLRYPKFGALLRANMETILPLSAEELEQAIVQPARRMGVIFERGLVTRLVSDMNYQAGALPLLQYALTELFDRRTGMEITQAAYDDIGGAVGALAQRAETTYQEMTPIQRTITRQMFLRLVTLSEGAQDTRRRAPRPELLTSTDDPEMMDEIIDMFSAYRLLSLDHDPDTRVPTVEVAHEAILHEWQRLQTWLDESRADIRLERVLAAAADDWQQAEREPSYLLHGARLEQLRAWADETDLALTEHERRFLEASSAEGQHQENLERERQERELETQRQLADQQRRAANRLRYLVGGLVIFLVVAIMLAVLATEARNEAQSARAEAEDSLRRTDAQRLGLESTSLAEAKGEADLIGLLAVRSLNTNYTPQGDYAIQQAIQRQFPEQVVLTGSPVGNDCITISPDGELLAIGGVNGVITVIAIPTNTVIRELSASAEIIHDITFVGDSKTVAVGQRPNIFVFDIETGEVIFTRDTTEDAFGKSIAYVPEGNILAVGSNVADVLLLDASTWEEIGRLETPGGAFEMGVSPDGRYLLTSQSAGSIVKMWDMATFTQVAVFDQSPHYATEPQISPDGTHLAVVTGGGGLWVWAVDQPDAPLYSIPNAHRAEIDTVAFTPDGQTIITGSQDNAVKFWDVGTGLPIAPDLPHPAQVTNLVLSHDGDHLYTVGTDPNIYVWATGFGNPVLHIPSQRHWYSQAFSPDGYKVASIRFNELRITDVATDDVFIYEHDVMLNPVAYSHDGKYVLLGTIPSGGQIGEVLLMDVAEERIVRSYDWTGWLVFDVGFSEDDQWVIASGLGDTAIWNIDTGERIFTATNSTSVPIMVTFDISPDNRYMIASSGWGEKAELIDLETGEVVWQTGLIPSESGVAFSPDGRYFVIGDGSRLVRMWDTATQTHVRDFVGHYRGITAVDFSSDGQWLASGSQDGTARIWNAATGEEVRRFQFDSVAHVLFSPDGENILIDDAINVTIWNADIADDVNYLCSHITRDFTDDERSFYEIGTQEATCQ